MGKRANGEGTVYFAPSLNLWIAQVSTDDGKRKSVYGKTKADAVQKKKDLDNKIGQGIRVVSSRLDAFLMEYLEISKNTLRNKTWTGYESLARIHLVPRLGKYKLSKLTPIIITNVYNKMISEGISVSTIKHCQSLLATVLNTAIKRNLMTYNPSIFATTPKTPSKEIRILSDYDIGNLLQRTNTNDSEYYPILFTALQTGMRRSELCALQWGDIDLDLAVIHVNRSIDRKDGKYYYLPPKTKKGSRSVDLTVGAVLYLRKLKELQQEQHGVEATSHVFRYTSSSRYSGRNILPDPVSKSFKRNSVAIGMTDINFHNTRHTHAGVLLKMGVHPKVVQERLGHASIQTTMDIYSHIAPNMQKDAIREYPTFDGMTVEKVLN